MCIVVASTITKAGGLPLSPWPHRIVTGGTIGQQLVDTLTMLSPIAFFALVLIILDYYDTKKVKPTEQ